MAATQQRGPITDHFEMGPEVSVPVLDGERYRWEMRRVALCVCVHGKEWPEGDLYEPDGHACEECSKAALAA